MKKTSFIKILLLLFTLNFFTYCGQDGQDGLAYIAFNWDWYVDTFTDNNPSTPSTISADEYYITDPGSYSYQYECSDGLGSYWSYSGFYTIYINEGEEGGLLSDGADGIDNYFVLSMYGNGAEYNTYKSQKIELEQLKPVGEIDFSNLILVEEIELEPIYVHSNTATMRIERTLRKYKESE